MYFWLCRQETWDENRQTKATNVARKQFFKNVLTTHRVRLNNSEEDRFFAAPVKKEDENEDSHFHASVITTICS